MAKSRKQVGAPSFPFSRPPELSPRIGPEARSRGLHAGQDLDGAQPGGGGAGGNDRIALVVIHETGRLQQPPLTVSRDKDETVFIRVDQLPGSDLGAEDLHLPTPTQGPAMRMAYGQAASERLEPRLGLVMVVAAALRAARTLKITAIVLSTVISVVCIHGWRWLVDPLACTIWR